MNDFVQHQWCNDLYLFDGMLVLCHSSSVFELYLLKVGRLHPVFPTNISVYIVLLYCKDKHSYPGSCKARCSVLSEENLSAFLSEYVRYIHDSWWIEETRPLLFNIIYQFIIVYYDYITPSIYIYYFVYNNNDIGKATTITTNSIHILYRLGK